MPKTIDNDLSATDYTFGFDTAVSICTEAIDRLHTTAESHNRVMVVEVMGRHTGWIAVMSGIAGGADVILIPEQPITVEEACAEITRRHESGKDFSIVVVSEGYELDVRVGRDDARSRRRRAPPTSSAMSASAGSATALAREIEERTGYETRVTVLGHVQRGGTPTAARPRARDPLRAEGGRPRRTTARSGRMAALRGDDDRRRLAQRGDRGAEDRAAGVVRGRRAFFG